MFRKFGVDPLNALRGGNELNASLYLMCAMMLFWTLGESIVSFIIPIRLEELGISDTMLGLILGSSSVAGALFDVIALRLFKNTYYKRIFSVMFLLCLIMPAIIMQMESLALFAVAMGMWGIYYDLKNIGNFDFISRATEDKNFTKSFGILQVCQNIGWILGPIIVGFLIGETLGWKPYAAIWIFLSISLICFIALCFERKDTADRPHRTLVKECKRGSWSEVKMVGKVGALLFPSLLVVFFLNFADAFFWSIGPLFSEHMGLDGLAGLFLASWTLPSLILGWFTGRVVARFGNERTSFILCFLGSVFFLPIFFLQGYIAILSTIFIASIFFSIASPAILGAFATYIDSRTELDKEIEGLEDLYVNLGYILGPITAGFLADNLGYANTFGILGIIGIVLSLGLILFVRKKIHLSRQELQLICDS